MGLRGPFVVLGLEPRLATCQAAALPAGLLLWPRFLFPAVEMQTARALSWPSGIDLPDGWMSPAGRKERKYCPGRCGSKLRARQGTGRLPTG